MLNSLVAIDFTEMQRRLAEYQPSMTIDPVTEQLEGCDPVIQVCTFTLTNEQLVNRLAILLERRCKCLSSRTSRIWRRIMTI